MRYTCVKKYGVAVEMSGLVKGLASRFRGLSEEDCDVWSLVRPERRSLTKLKRLSIRRRAWFRVLSWKQRRLIDVVVRTVDRVRSGLLLRVLAPLVKKLLTVVGGDARRGALALMDVGAYRMMRDAAEKIVQTALKWGNKGAREWLDEGFLRYLLVMNLPQNNNSVVLV